MTSEAVQPIVVLLSDRVAANPAQYVIEKAFAHHNLDWRYATVEVSAEGFGDAVRGIRAMGFSGGHCGEPYQQAVIPLLDRTTETAELVGAVNLVFRQRDALVGENTQGKGVVEALRREIDPAEKRFVLLGAGRIGRAIGVELAAAGAAEITVVDHREEPARELADLLVGRLHVTASAAAWQDDFAIPPETDVLINATSIGDRDGDARVPIRLEGLRPEMVVADVTCDPPQTWLLREAAGRGCTTVDGLGIYLDQVALDIKIWTGVDPDRQVMREAIEEFLEL